MQLYLEAAMPQSDRRDEISRVKAELADAKAELEKLGQFTGSLAHEFNNVLMAVLGNLDLLSRALSENGPGRSLVNAAILAAERGASLTKRMLVFARPLDWRPEMASPSLSPPAASPGHGRSYAVLFVDDDPMVALGTSAMLNELGHRVVMASSGALALDVIRSGAAIDLVITDHAMPGMTGTELAMLARELRPGLPIILATGYADAPSSAVPDMARLDKPYRLDTLAATIASVVGRGVRDRVPAA
jgi:CheY-like chemotaxis protein